MLTVTSSGLTKVVAARRLKEIVSTVGCMVGDSHHLPTSRPRARNVLSVKEVKQQNREPGYPLVWRDRLAATIQLAATPEARSLTSL